MLRRALVSVWLDACDMREVVPVLASRSSDSSAWKRTEGRTREGRGESSGTVAFIDSVAVQAISSRMKAERVLKGFILRDL